MPLTPGSTFERYEIQSLIGRGGMGEVYRAIDTRLHRPVALKVLRTDKDAVAAVTEAGGVARLLREARAAAALNHANSVAIYELGEAEGIAYIAMELVTGVTFRRYLGEGNVSIDTKVSWLVDAARALWAAHKAGLVHRDVKPGNIMVSEEGVVKVLDFGLAKAVAVQGNPAEFQTSMGQVLGTPRYMAPERLEGSPADASADQFAFGLTAYELISGVYAGGPLAGMVPPVHERVPNASAELGRAIARMMSRAPAARFPTMEAAAHALRSCLGSQPGAAGVATARPVRSEPPRDAAGARPSEARTAVVQGAEHLGEEPASAERAIGAQRDGLLARGATLPLGIPMKVAIGDRASAPGAPLGSLDRTMPLARPMTGMPVPAPSTRVHADPEIRPRITDGNAPSYPSPSGAPGAPSGVYASRSHADAEALRTTGGTGRSRRAEAPADASRTWIVIVAVALVAVAMGGVAAWFLR